MAYLPLSTANLPDPVIDPAQGSTADEYFDVGLWTGDGVNGRTIADLYGHTPDFVWIKNRTNAIDHNVADVLRGWKELYPNLTNAEGSQQMNAPTNDGLSGLPNANGYNASGSTYVSWAWKANGTGVSNTDGSITSTVSANTDSGFSICTYTGNNTDGATFGHGLTSAPEMVIFKRRDSASSWAVGHTDLGWDGIVILNSTNAFNTGYNIFNSTAPSSSVVTLGNTGDANEGNIVAYCFHSVEGFSKFGSYQGNSSADGPFIYTGFRPAFVMVKRAITTSSGGWAILDSKRAEYNPETDVLLANDSIAETSGYLTTDLLSNGFKLRDGSGTSNNSSSTYIYMAFAEQPMKFSNAR